MLLEADTKLRSSTCQLDVLSLRATVARVDEGSRTVTFDSEHEGRFILNVSDEHLATLHEGHEYEVTAEVEASHGRLLELERVKEVVDLKQALKDMFREACSGWSSAEEFDKSVRGDLLELEQVENLAPEDEKKRWRDWFGQAGADWDEVEDIEVELGRPSLEGRQSEPTRRWSLAEACVVATENVTADFCVETANGTGE